MNLDSYLLIFWCYRTQFPIRNRTHYHCSDASFCKKLSCSCQGSFESWQWTRWVVLLYTTSSLWLDKVSFTYYLHRSLSPSWERSSSRTLRVDQPPHFFDYNVIIVDVTAKTPTMEPTNPMREHNMSMSTSFMSTKLCDEHSAKFSIARS